MLDKDKLLSFNYFKYNGILTGDHFGMRYQISRSGEKPDFILQAFVWPEPFSREKTPDELILEKDFSYSEEGRKEAIDWLLFQYEERKDDWNASKSVLDAPHK